MCLIKFSEKVESYNLIFISSIYLFDRNHCKKTDGCKKEPQISNLLSPYSPKPLQFCSTPLFHPAARKKKIGHGSFKLYLSLSLSAKSNQKRRDLWMGANNGATYYAILQTGGPWKEPTYNAIHSLSLSLYLYLWSPHRCHVGAPGNVVNELSRAWSSRGEHRRIREDDFIRAPTLAAAFLEFPWPQE